jgi:carbon-monoxide dehydrogenase medium subunit
MWDQYFVVSKVEDALGLLSKGREKCRLVAGATDLILELERGTRKGVDTLVDISRLPGLETVFEDAEGMIHLGPLVTHNQCVASQLLRKKALPLVQACWQVGSPQIRNRGTVAGNLVTASPANDTIGPLMALGAKVKLRSASGERIVALENFYTGVRRTVLEPDEMLVDLWFQVMKPMDRGVFLKLALRNAQAISLLNITIVLHMEGEVVATAAVTLGAVAPTIIHAEAAEAFLAGKYLSEEVIQAAAELAGGAARPIDDIRSSALYRKEMVEVIARRGMKALETGDNLVPLPEKPVLLAAGSTPLIRRRSNYRQNAPIETVINGKAYSFPDGHHKSLARLLREDGLLTGTKIACAEGECGACTIWLDGKAVMGCLVPAPRAHGAEILTVEGLEKNGDLHPVQLAFIQYGAVQCGFCSPGFLMSAAMLLEEKPMPTHEDVLHAVSGNLCRCTGYYKIIEAVESAARIASIS